MSKIGAAVIEELETQEITMEELTEKGLTNGSTENN
jgi:hypothetical protein